MARAIDFICAASALLAARVEPRALTAVLLFPLRSFSLRERALWSKGAEWVDGEAQEDRMDCDVMRISRRLERESARERR
jgi:hypothetical protein